LRLVVIGLDSVPPKLLYDDFRGELEVIESIADSRNLLRTVV
jgi:predicted AlkP superfamily phosphohydrolase/phosphomutase